MKTTFKLWLDILLASMASLPVVPLYLLMALARDRLLGDGELSYELLYSRRELLEFITDSVVPVLPATVLYCVVLLLLVRYGVQGLPGNRILNTSLAAMLLGALTGLWLLSAYSSAVLIFALVGAVTGMLFSMLLLVERFVPGVPR